MREPDLGGKTALVTGGGRGIGRATAVALSRCGARVVLTARGRAEIEVVAAEIERGGGQARAIPADISWEEDVRRLFEEAGTIDILVNNAGVIQPIAPLASADPQAWLYNIAVNLNGPFLTCRYALPGMLERGWGRIINLSAGVSSGRMPSWSAYSAAKAGLETLTKVIARETGDRGVRANVVRPGIVDTRMQEEIRGTSEEQFGRENLEKYRGYKEQGTLRAPEDPAKLILWALSPEAENLNGEILAIDDPETAAKIGVIPRGR
jgi:NAD(P)-dependent dehydrogenase (short-subunit alcohol dehydrogenase family)